MADLNAPNKDDPAFFFELAIRQLAKINLFFHIDKCEYSSLKAVCAGIKNRHFIVRVPLAEIDKTPIIWGSEVSGYFTVRDDELTFCNFRTRLARIYNAPPDAIFLVMPLPRHIDHDQRRFSKRVNLDESWPERFTVWHGMMDGGNMEAPPLLRWMSLEARHCELAEMSATGLRIDFSEKSPILAKIAIEDEILLKGNFGTPGKDNYVFVLANVVRIMPKPDMEGVVSVGCHFRSWRKVVEDRASQTWFRVDTHEGIGFVAQWLGRHTRVAQK